MKKIAALIVTLFILTSCSNEDENSPTVYTYEIKRNFGRKVSLKAEAIQNSLIFNKSLSYTIDTLEISLNGANATAFSFRVDISTFNTTTTLERSETPHVNYIKFIDLKTIWEDNKSKKIFLEDKNYNPPKFFTYSGCNINLSNYPQFFVNNPNIPSYSTLGVKSIVNNIEIFESKNVYAIGDIISRDGIQYKVISKK